MGHITIKDIAGRLKRSPSTVSRALKDHPNISRATKERILSIAALIEPPPTTVDPPAFEIGQTAAGLLLRQLEDEKKPRAPRPKCSRRS